MATCLRDVHGVQDGIDFPVPASVESVSTCWAVPGRALRRRKVRPERSRTGGRIRLRCETASGPISTCSSMAVTTPTPHSSVSVQPSASSRSGSLRSRCLIRAVSRATSARVATRRSSLSWSAPLRCSRILVMASRACSWGNTRLVAGRAWRSATGSDTSTASASVSSRTRARTSEDRQSRTATSCSRFGSRVRFLPAGGRSGCARVSRAPRRLRCRSSPGGDDGDARRSGWPEPRGRRSPPGPAR